MLELDQVVAAEPALEGQCLLGEIRFEPQSAHIASHAGARHGPALLTLGVGGVAANGHPVMSRQLDAKVCPTSSA